MAKLNFKTTRGAPEPYGASKSGSGINFSLFSTQAASVTLCLISPEKEEIVQEIPLSPKENRTGNVWHIRVEDFPEDFYYAYHVDGPNGELPKNRFDPKLLLLDPFAKSVSTPNEWGKGKSYTPYGSLQHLEEFDWENDEPPGILQKDLIIYEMHVRGFTQHPSSNVSHPGTYLGLIEKIPHLIDLGVNAVELLPIHEFNEKEYSKIDPTTKKRLYNYWGYSTSNFFSPMNRYATSRQSAVKELKQLIKELHKNQIEVILDVVFNHTAEGNDQGPTFSFRGIDNATYYILDQQGQYMNFSGCGNTFNCNHPVVRILLRQALRYWVKEMHVDGFRFDLASILTRDSFGNPMGNAPIVDAISNDPLLAATKLIAEPWDAAGLYQVGEFYPQQNRWSEWNGKYRDSVRGFINGLSVSKGEFATRISGSQDLYGRGRSPSASINFITAHDGFSLMDLVSYNQKHNMENGEENRDGTDANDSWNCGIEGTTFNKKIVTLRERQVKNFQLALMVSTGIPMLLMGDEYGHTRRGNNNPYCHDNDLNWFLWDQLEENPEYYRFYRGMIHFRRTNPLLRRDTFLNDQDILWHGLKPMFADWSNENKLIAFTIVDHDHGKDIYCCFNAQNQSAVITLPTSKDDMVWQWIANTSQTSPEDFWQEGTGPLLSTSSYKIAGHAAVLLKATHKATK